MRRRVTREEPYQGNPESCLPSPSVKTQGKDAIYEPGSGSPTGQCLTLGLLRLQHCEKCISTV